MTRDEILQLQPGEELDRLVALTLEPQPADVDDEYWERDELNDVVLKDEFRPSFQPSLNGFWRLYYMETRHEPVRMSTVPILALRLWDAIVAKEHLWVRIYRDAGISEARIGDEWGKILKIEAATWPHALCVSWLLWCEEHGK